AVRSWATAYSAGLTSSARRGPRVAFDLAFTPSSGGFVTAFTWGLSLGAAVRLGRFEVGATVDGQLADASDGDERHLGLLLRGGLALPERRILSPRVDLLAGLRLWQFDAADGRVGVDPTVPTFAAQLSLDVLLGAGLRATVGLRGELALPSIDGARTP